MDFELSGKLVLISGSTNGIGWAIAQKFGEVGSKVILNGRSDAVVAKKVDELKQYLAGKGVANADKNVFGIAADVSTTEGAEKLVAETNKIGTLEVLVNNMGIFESKPLSDITDEEWVRYMNVNVVSGARLSRAFLPGLLQRNSGSVIFVSSEAALCPKAFMIHYSTTKTAQLGLARGLAEMTKGTNVRVNTVLPGPTWTEGVSDYIQGIANQKGLPKEEVVKSYMKEVEPTSLIQRFIQPEEVANVVVFLSSRLASCISGSAVLTEGGIVRHI